MAIPKTLALAVGLLLAGSAGVLADTRTSAPGDGTGTAFATACDPGEALVGFDYNNAEMLLSVSAICKPVLPGGLGAAHRLKQMFGPSDQHVLRGGHNSTRCPDDMVVRGLQVFVGLNLAVERVRLSCHVASGNKVGLLVKHTNSSSATYSTASKSVDCPGIQYATGLLGTYKGGVRSLGLLCHDDTPAAGPTGSDGKVKGQGGPFGKGQGGPFGKGGDHGPGHGPAGGPFGRGGGDMPLQFEIHIGPGGASLGAKGLPFGPEGGQFGPKGKVRVLREASTVYADRQGTEIAYLDAGARVTVVTCENSGHGWCRISGPTPGLIWGGDLK